MRYVAQIASTLGAAMFVVFLRRLTGYRGSANWVAIVAPPVIIGLACDDPADRRTFMALALTFIHLLAVSVLGVVVVGY